MVRRRQGLDFGCNILPELASSSLLCCIGIDISATVNLLPLILGPTIIFCLAYRSSVSMPVQRGTQQTGSRGHSQPFYQGAANQRGAAPVRPSAKDNFVNPGPLTVNVNCFEITNLPQIIYYQYDGKPNNIHVCAPAHTRLDSKSIVRECYCLI